MTKQVICLSCLFVSLGLLVVMAMGYASIWNTIPITILMFLSILTSDGGANYDSRPKGDK